jgi:CRP-like cAMP-binding protein
MAKTDVECYRVDKDVFEEILRARPSIAEEMTHLLVTRRAELDAALHDIDAQTVLKDASQQHNEILSTIKRFFSLNI